MQKNSGVTANGFIQILQSIETSNSIPFAGKTVTFSFYARKGANFSDASSQLGIQVLTGTGTDQNATGYTGSATPITGNATLTTTWQRFTFIGALSSSLTELGLNIFYQTVGTAGAADYFEITGIQIDIGSVALPFRTYAATIQGELAACQRYYYRVTPTAAGSRLGVGYATTTGATNILMTFPVTMRTAPTALEQSGTASDYSIAYAATSAVCNAVPVLNIADNTCGSYNFATATALVVGNGVIGRAVNTSAYIGWSAEL